ncbi:MAG: YggS family pyridoxal phosphate-dependent enzyme [Bryobacteraceae bacterium]|nr:YggS family pyridoxal phosphate-dependent enzyme [Bryobacteraceae bacterium]
MGSTPRSNATGCFAAAINFWIVSQVASCWSDCILQSCCVLAERLRDVEERIANACASSGRNRSDITLVGVTKIFPFSVIAESHELGLRHFGENYVQEFSDKAPNVSQLEGAVFHLIGHLQSNKSARAAELFNVVQTVDSPKLARRLNESGKALKIMIEVKLSAEESKHGAAPDELKAILGAVAECPNLQLLGLMTMPPWSDEPEQSRPYFAKLREIASEYRLQDLSMGMSHDLEVAIAEGATHIRVGTALFGKRQKT